MFIKYYTIYIDGIYTIYIDGYIHRWHYSNISFLMYEFVFKALWLGLDKSYVHTKRRYILYCVISAQKILYISIVFPNRTREWSILFNK